MMEFENGSSVFRTVVLTSAEGKKQVLHIHQDSDSKLEAMFNPSEMFQSVPYKERNLPMSFFNPPNQPRKPHHFHSRSTGVLDMSMPSNNCDSNYESSAHHKHVLSNNNNNNNNSYSAMHLMPPAEDLHLHNQNARSEYINHLNSLDLDHNKKRYRHPRIERKRAFHSQITHGRSKSFPELLDMRRMANESGCMPAREAPYQNGFSDKYNESHNEPVPMKNIKTENPEVRGLQKSSPFAELSHHSRSASSFEPFQFGSPFGIQNVMSQQDNVNAATWSDAQVQNNHFAPSVDPYQTDFNDQTNTPADSFLGGSMMMRLMQEKDSFQRRIPHQTSPSHSHFKPPLPSHVSYHKRDASYDSGLGLGGLSLAPDEHTSKISVQNDQNLRPNEDFLQAAASLLPHEPLLIDDQLEELLESLPASNVDGNFDVTALYDQQRHNDPNRNAVRGYDVINGQRGALSDVTTTESKSVGAKQNHTVWL